MGIDDRWMEGEDAGVATGRVSKCDQQGVASRMYADQMQAADDSGRKRRVLSIEELRRRLGVAAPVDEAARPSRTETGERKPPRIVRRKELIAAY